MFKQAKRFSVLENLEKMTKKIAFQDIIFQEDDVPVHELKTAIFFTNKWSWRCLNGH